MRICNKCKLEYKYKCTFCYKQYQKEYRNKNKEKAKEYSKKYRKDNKIQLKEKKKKYYHKNKDRLINLKKEYYAKNKDKLKKYIKEYALKNKHKIKERLKKYRKDHGAKLKKDNKKFYKKNKLKRIKYAKDYYIANRKKVLKRLKTYRKYKMLSDPKYKLRHLLSSAICSSLKINKSSKNNNSCLKYLPYTLEELKRHLESKFESWMNWNNHGPYRISSWNDNDPSTWTWHIDHIIPHSVFKYTSMQDQSFQNCWSLSNLQPLSAKQNIVKGAKHEI